MAWRNAGCLAIDLADNIRSIRVIELLSKLVSVHGAPRVFALGNSQEFISRTILRLRDTGFIDSGQVPRCLANSPRHRVKSFMPLGSTVLQ
jgi:hypothetical protein